MSSTFRFLQGVFPVTGAGLDKHVLLDESLTYEVPEGRRAQVLYFRGGNASDELVIVVLVRDGVPMRWFPIGAKGDVHVPLRVVEDVEAGEVLELHLARCWFRRRGTDLASLRPESDGRNAASR